MELNKMNKQIQSIKELFNNIRDTLSPNKIKEIQTKIYKKKAISDYLTEQNNTSRQSNVLKNNIATYFNKLHKYLLRKNKEHKDNRYHINDLYDLDLLFNADDYYKPIEVKSAFNGKYVLYESNGDKNGLLSIYEYFWKTKPYLRDLIDFYNTKGEWKVQLSMQISFKILFDSDEIQIMHSKSDNVEIMSGLDTNDIIEELIDTFGKRYQDGLETKMKGSNYVFERVELLEYHFHKISLHRGGS